MSDGDVKRNRKALLKNELKKGTPNLEFLIENWTQCCYFIKDKRRMCNIARSTGSLYCGVHQEPGQVSSTRIEKEAKFRKIEVRRVPCPIDPSHTVYEHKLESHIKTCNVLSDRKELELLGVYRENYNSGGICGNCSGSSVDSNYACIDHHNLLMKIRWCFQHYVSAHLQRMNQINSINQETNIEYILNKVEEPLHTLLYQLYSELSGDQTSVHRTRHAVQDVCIILKMIKNRVLPNVTELLHQSSAVNETNDLYYVEFGAGKGYLGYSIQYYYYLCRRLLYSTNTHHSEGAVTPTLSIPHFVFVERSGARRKADNRALGEDIHNNCSRFRVDIRHSYLYGVLEQCAGECNVDIGHSSGDELRGVIVSVVAKHLCGVATDLTLRNIKNLYKDCRENKRKCTATVSIATCCHHCCNYDDYVGTEWLSTLETPYGIGFSREEFRQICTWSSWATLPSSEQWNERVRAGAVVPVTMSSSASDGSSTVEGNDDEHTPNGTAEAAVSDAERLESPQAEHTTPTNATHSSTGGVIIPKDGKIIIGTEVKCILDYGRLLYMKEELGIQSSYEQYCNPSLSPECMTLLGVSC